MVARKRGIYRREFASTEERDAFLNGWAPWLTRKAVSSSIPGFYTLLRDTLKVGISGVRVSLYFAKSPAPVPLGFAFDGIFRDD